MSALEEIENCWNILNNPPLVAGPWVPVTPYLGCPRGMYRYNYVKQPLAFASSQEEIVMEDARLERLGYFLTDKSRIIRPEWWESLRDSQENSGI